MLPDNMQEVSLPVNAGDSITASLNEGANNQWQISIKNNTNGQSFATSVTYVSSNSSAEWIEETPSLSNGLIAPLDNFGSVTFTNGSAVVNGVSENIAAAGATAMTMLDGSNQTIASASTLFSDNSGFTVTRSVVQPVTVTPTFFVIPFRYRPQTTITTSYTPTPHMHHRFSRRYQFGFDPSGTTMTQFTWTW